MRYRPFLDGPGTLRYPKPMQIFDTDIDGVKIVEPARHADERGWLTESWNPAALADAGLDIVFVQDNLTHSRATGVVRALHFQAPPFEQGKLIVCLTGAIYDVALDVRVGSPTYGRHVGLRLSGDEPRQLWIPPGFAHGFCSLAPDTKVLYKLSARYHGDAMMGVLWNDPALEIDWPIDAGAATVVERDRNWPLFEDFRSPFRWEG